MSPLRHGLVVFGAALALLLWMAPPLSSYLANSDHGYQLSLARLITLGAFPYVDLIFHYGPLVAWTSALALWWSGGLIGETVVCAAGYAAALACLASAARARIGWIAGWAVPLVALLFLARFYKWYFWLFPAVTLLLFHRYLKSESAPPERGLFMAGLTAGFCALYRLDLGLVLAVFWGIVALTGRRGLIQARFAAAGLRVAAGFAAPMAAWLLVLAAVGGAEAVASYAAATLDGGTGVVSGWSRGPAPFDAGAPFSPASGLRIALWIVPLCFVAGLVLGGWRSLRGPDERQADARFLAGASLLGIGLLPQAFYRADGHHLLQALSPFFVVAPLLVRQLLHELAGRAPGWKNLGRAAVAAAVLATVVAAVAIRPFGARDLAPIASNGFERLAELARGLTAQPRDPLAAAIRELSSTVPESARILVIPWTTCQVYFFAERSMSGMFNMYAPHILDDPAWRRRNLEQIRAHPPAAVLVAAGFLNPRSKPARVFRSFQPELDGYLRSNYTEVGFRRGPLQILRRASPSSPQ